MQENVKSIQDEITCIENAIKFNYKKTSEIYANEIELQRCNIDVAKMQKTLFSSRNSLRSEISELMYELEILQKHEIM